MTQDGMLFNSYAFVFAFLPLSLLIYHSLRRRGLARESIFALTLLSLLEETAETILARQRLAEFE